MKVLVQNQKSFKKDLSKIPSDIKIKILKKIELLKNFPDLDFSVRKLRNLKVADFRVRIGDYRVLFCVDEEQKEIRVIGVKQRKESYKK